MADNEASEVLRDPKTGIIWWVYPRAETLEVVSRVVEEIMKIAEETGEKRVVFDARRLDSTSSIWGIFERTELVAKRVQGKGMRVAALFSNHIPVKETQFLEDVARNRGMELTVQPDKESALRWLDNKPETRQAPNSSSRAMDPKARGQPGSRRR
ncbi:MAG: hypothetical protein Q6373_009190 [Candidatus Sigynarchaeota archaeon]